MKINPIILQIMNNRGIVSEDEVAEFISDKPQKTYDPFLLPNMEEGVDLILSAIEDEKKICIYGDYDADGVTSVSLLMDVLGHLTENLIYYIPSRFDEGYGLNCDAIDKIKEMGADLIITVDCGSVSYVEVRYAKRIGLDIIVTDHHSMGERVPDCLVINPMHPENRYPFRYLAGVGVAFKLAQAVADVSGLPKSVITRNLDLVGIGTIGDIVPLVDENRTLAKFGLRALNITQRKGLKQLIDSVGLKQGSIKSEDVSFRIVPYINASGRMADADCAAEVMQTKSKASAESGVEKLIGYNNLRKSKQNELYKECQRIVEEKYANDRFILLELENAHEGITGIVAGKLKETYNVPSLIVTPTDENFYKGTGRSIEGVNIHAILKKCEKLFTRFGGHAAACGFTIEKSKIGELRACIESELNSLYEEKPELLNEKASFDAELGAENIDDDLINQMQLLEPFGRDNQKPVFGIQLKAKDISRMGNEKQYLRFTGILSDGRNIKCVSFKKADKIENAIESSNGNVRITGNITKEFWNGKSYLQIEVYDAE